MRIEGNDQLIRPDAVPNPTIDAVRRTDHPAKIKIHALAGTAIGRRRQKKSHTDTPLEFASWIELLVAGTEHRRGEARERGSCVGIAGRQSREKGVVQRS